MPLEAFEKMAQPGFMREVATYLGGYSVAAAADYGADEFTQRDIPGEFFGPIAAAGMEYAPVVSGQNMRRMQVGAVAYSAEALIDRLGVTDAVTEAI